MGIKKDDTNVKARVLKMGADPEKDDRIFPTCDVRYMYAIAVCLLYPVYYDGTQFIKQGAAYFGQSSNYIDLYHIGFGFLNIYCQMSENGTWNIWSKIVMISVILTCLAKTFFFMRIFVAFSYIVTMIVRVGYDLQIFLSSSSF